MREFPVPPLDNAIGFHGSAGASAMPGDPIEYARYLRHDLGATWFKLFVDGTVGLAFARAMADEGIQVIVRFHEPTQGAPHPNFIPPGEAVAAYYAVGVRYFECGNEPNLHLEWEGGQIWPAAVDMICQQWLNACGMVEGVGADAHCLFYALSPGGHYPHPEFYRTAFDWLEQRGELQRLARHGMAVHNRPLNHPLLYPDDAINQATHPGATLEQDSVCFRLYEWLDDTLRARGVETAFFATEAGPELTQEDDRYPRLTPELHAEMVRDIIKGFRGEHADPRLNWRSSLKCQCFWMLEGLGHFSFQYNWWRWNLLYEGRDLPALGVFRELSGFVRGTAPTPPPDGGTSEPVPIPEPLPGPLPPAEYWHNVSVRRLTPEQNHMRNLILFHPPDVPMLVKWRDGEHVAVRDFWLGRGEYTVQVANAEGDLAIVPGADFPDEPPYLNDQGEWVLGNTNGHFSYEVIFEREEIMPYTREEIISIITEEAATAGVRPALALAVAEWESGLDPLIIGDTGHSVGLYQLHDQGMGAGMTVAERQDPRINARTALTVMGQRIRESSETDALGAHNAGATGWQDPTTRAIVLERYVTPILASAERWEAELGAETPPLPADWNGAPWWQALSERDRWLRYVAVDGANNHFRDVELPQRDARIRTLEGQLRAVQSLGRQVVTAAELSEV